MEEEQKTHQLEELIPSISGFVSHLKKVGINGEIPETFRNDYPWVDEYLKKTDRVENLWRIGNQEDLRIEYVNYSDLKCKGIPRNLRIRVSFSDVRHQTDIHSEVLTFQEIYPDKFIYLPI
ncbi:MAG: hypothetical protein WC087_00335 [Candidatus Paceibacterota bacterium]